MPQFPSLKLSTPFSTPFRRVKVINTHLKDTLKVHTITTFVSYVYMNICIYVKSTNLMKLRKKWAYTAISE
jgi:hypothetical protein